MAGTVSLAGKTAVVTGATSGIGLAAAILLVQHGARVIGIGRSPQRCQAAEGQVKAACPEAHIHYLLADLSSQGQIRRLAEEIRTELARHNLTGLDCLVNNAGTYSQKKLMTVDGIELTFATNHLAPFLLTHELLPLLQTSPTGRVITVSSDSHARMTLDPNTIQNPSFYIGIMAYGKSKLANVLFTAEFNRRYAGSTVHAYAVDPGLVKTDIALKGQPAFSRLLWKWRSSAGVDPTVPARTILFLCSDDKIQNSPETYWFDSHPKTASRQAARPDLAKALWQASLILCGLPDEKLEDN